MPGGGGARDSIERQLHVLAAWCGAEAHLAEPGAINLAPGQADLLTRVAARRTASTPPPPRALPSADAARRRGLSLLLRECRAMEVQDKRKQGHGKALHPWTEAPPGTLGRAFLLLLCPSCPDWAAPDVVAAAATRAVSRASNSLMLLACIIVPVWLVLVRELARHSLLAGAAGACVGLALAAACEAAQRRAAAAPLTVTAASVAALLPPRGTGCGELDALRAAGAAGAAPTCGGHAQPAPACGSGGGNSCTSLLPELARLQAVLGVHSAGEPPSSAEVLSAELEALCRLVGIDLPARGAPEAAAHAQTLARLRQHVGA